MTYFKTIRNGLIVETGIASEPYETEIDASEWERIQSAFAKKPSDNYVLTESLEWIQNEEATESDYIEALQDLGVEVDG